MFSRLFTRSLVAAGIGALALAAGFGFFASAGAADAAGPDAATPDAPAVRGVWPDWVQGVPYDFEAGARNGWYFWESGDETGRLHICSTTPSDRDHPFTAVFTTNGTFVNVDKTRLEDADDIVIGDGGHRLALKFHTHDGIDCADFTVMGGSWLTARLEEFGALVPTSRINVGRLSLQPRNNPFTIRKSAP